MLVGGLGTRLRNVLPDLPKPLAEIDNRPFLHYLLGQLADAGIQRTILCTGHKAEKIARVFGNRFDGRMDLIYSHEENPMGTGGALRLAADKLEGNIALVANGDSYVATDLNKFVSWHFQSKHPGSLLLVRMEDASRFGSVVMDDRGKITNFEEKTDSHRSGWINGGIYLLSRDLLYEIPQGCSVSLERQMFPKWISTGDLYGYPVEDPFLDIGTPESLAAANIFFASLR